MLLRGSRAGEAPLIFDEAFAAAAAAAAAAALLVPLSSFSCPATRGIILFRLFGIRGPLVRVVEELAVEPSVGLARPVASVWRRLFTMVVWLGERK